MCLHIISDGYGITDEPHHDEETNDVEVFNYLTDNSVTSTVTRKMLEVFDWRAPQPVV